MDTEKLKFANKLAKEIELFSEISSSKPMPTPDGCTPIVKIIFGYAESSDVDQGEYQFTSDKAIICTFPVGNSMQRALERAIITLLQEHQRALKTEFENL